MNKYFLIGLFFVTVTVSGCTKTVYVYNDPKLIEEITGRKAAEWKQPIFCFNYDGE